MPHNEPGHRLLVTVSLPESMPAEQVLLRLDRARGKLRSEVAAAVRRRRAPELVFRVLWVDFSQSGPPKLLSSRRDALDFHPYEQVGTSFDTRYAFPRAVHDVASDQWLATWTSPPSQFGRSRAKFAFTQQFAGDIAWILPGIWSILFGLGVFASRRLLPKATFLVGGFYLLAGLYMISMHYEALAAWTMGVTFGVGQIAAAALLYFTLERQRERPVEQPNGKQ